MKIPSLSLKRSLDVTLNDTFQRFKYLDYKDSQALRDEYKEWIEAREGDGEQPLVLYLNQINPDN